MRTSLKWGFLGVVSALGALACSGTQLNDVGDLNGAGSSSGGSNSSGSNGIDPNRGGAQNAGVGGSVQAAGSGQTAGREGVLDPQGGEGGQTDSEPLTCPACVEVALGQDVRSIAVDDQRVFWVDYGTTDTLGNYQNNGRLLTRSLDGGATSVLADSLLGPNLLATTSQYAYVFVDRQSEIHHASGLMRVPLAGGPATLLQDLVTGRNGGPAVFASGPGYEYWIADDTVYRAAETPDATPEILLAGRGVDAIFVVGTQLFFEEPDGIWTMPLAGGDPLQIYAASQMNATSIGALQVAGGYLYGIERQNRASPTQAYLTRVAISEGAWQRIVSFPDGSNLVQLAVDGDGYFIDEPTLTERRILQGSLTMSTPPQTIVASQPVSRNESWTTFQAWQLSRVGMFIADARGLYLTPTATP